jgi:hypothetical protein
MKIVSMIARLLMGLAFVVFGMNGFLHFIPQPPPTSEIAGRFFAVMMESHYMIPVFAIQVVSGLLFLVNRFVPLALTLIAPVIVNILIYHATIDLPGIVPGLVTLVLWVLIYLPHRQAFAALLKARPIGQHS